MPDNNNGLGIGWQILFKVNMLILPLVIAWATWATANIFELKGFANVGDRFTATDAINLELRVKEWTRTNYPTPEMKQDIKDIKAAVQEINIKLASDDHD